ncbi:Zn-dependent M28 family amino/carboxypeptidase [Microterricola gilva]|uniref:Zn-dependent M28 family amino/carboxypeptidase n=1 Tax=Microterricola gilva TaxID=393267 RepID=A0A4Q8AQN5_9MICO|nr:M20/M25/M40 family metallo-hydrolase [Microterricola gilva]RZU66531.1 Zn-dependent M28 family amino/carboxypeptidase [Microterricola gilva]
MQKRAMALAGLVLAAVVLVPATPALAGNGNGNNGNGNGNGGSSTEKLLKAVTVNGILQHERALQRIANNNGGTRASGTSGFDASAAYVSDQLRKAGYTVTSQPFDFPYFEETGPASLSQVSPTPTDYEVSTLEYSGNGEVTGAIVPTLNVVIPATPTPSSASGCLPEDFTPASATEPEVALIQRGTCTFEVKVANAAAAGYDAAAIFNEGNPGRTDLLAGVTLGVPAAIPVVGLSYADGVALYDASQAGSTVVALSTSTISETRTTTNVLADSKRGDPGKVVVVGAHLDSVLVGPGINDNGSGTATILETAIQMANLNIKPQQQLRFAFWGAEENNLLGSTHYVDTLSDVQLATIYANLNFDMLGSPNYVRFVYDGDGSADPEGIGGPPGSAQIEAVFTDYFASKGLASEPTAFDGRSDYGPFIAVGIPAGGLFSGAEGLKTAEEAVVYGGTAGAPYDACYHQACDTVDNLSTAALNELGDAAAHSIMTLAVSKTGFFEDGSRMAKSAQLDVSSVDYWGSKLIR